MGNAFAADAMPLLVTMVDLHNPRSHDMFYFCSVSSGSASSKVIGRSQTISVEASIETTLSLVVYECPEPVFTPETARYAGLLRIPVERLAQQHNSGIFHQWFNLDTASDPREPAGDPAKLASKFEQSYSDAVEDVYQPKVCLSVIGTAFEVDGDSRGAFNIFVGEEVKTEAGPDLKALIASHKQQAAYIDALHEELRRLSRPTYRAVSAAGMPGTPCMAFPNTTCFASTPPSVAFSSAPPLQVLSAPAPQLLSEHALPRLLGAAAPGHATLPPQVLKTHFPASPASASSPVFAASAGTPLFGAGWQERQGAASPTSAALEPGGWSTPPGAASPVFTPPTAGTPLEHRFGVPAPAPPMSARGRSSSPGPAVGACLPFGPASPRTPSATSLHRLPPPSSRASSAVSLAGGPAAGLPSPAGAPAQLSPRLPLPSSRASAAPLTMPPGGAASRASSTGFGRPAAALPGGAASRASSPGFGAALPETTPIGTVMLGSAGGVPAPPVFPSRRAVPSSLTSYQSFKLER